MFKEKILDRYAFKFMEIHSSKDKCYFIERKNATSIFNLSYLENKKNKYKI